MICAPPLMPMRFNTGDGSKTSETVERRDNQEAMQTELLEVLLHATDSNWIEVRREGRTAIIGKLIQELWNVNALVKLLHFIDKLPIT